MNKINYTDTIRYVETSEPDRVAEYIDNLEQQLAKKDKKIEQLKEDVKSQKSVADLYLTIASSSATKMSIAKAVSKQVCDEIRSSIDNENYELWGDNIRILSIRADDFNKILDKIEKEIENGN